MIPGKIREGIAKEINWEVAKALGIKEELTQAIDSSKIIYFDGKDTFYLENVPENFKEDMKKFVEGLKAFSKKENPFEKLNLDKILDENQKKFNSAVEKSNMLLSELIVYSCFYNCDEIVTAFEENLEKLLMETSYLAYEAITTINKFSNFSKSLYFEERSNKIVRSNILSVVEPTSEIERLVKTVSNFYYANDLSKYFIENLDEASKETNKTFENLIQYVQANSKTINEYYNELNKFVTELKQNDVYKTLQRLQKLRVLSDGFYSPSDDIITIPKPVTAFEILHEIIHRCGTYSQNKYLKPCGHPQVSGRAIDTCEYMTTLLTCILLKNNRIVRKTNKPNNAYDFAKHIAASLPTDRLVEFYKNIAEELLNKEPEEFFEGVTKYLERQ
jgi:adenylate kinase family enzyme